MRRQSLIAVFALAAAMAGPALAGAKFATYEGRDAVREGEGGTRVEKDGVDFWTTGTPPRRYQVIGILTDKRNDCLLCGNAIGSGSLAKRVKALGGDAVVLLDQSTRVKGAVVNYGLVTTVRRDTTQLLVVRYLDPPSEPGAPTHSPP
jgi:hypothetical protein